MRAIWHGFGISIQAHKDAIFFAVSVLVLVTGLLMNIATFPEQWRTRTAPIDPAAQANPDEDLSLPWPLDLADPRGPAFQ